MDDRLDQLSEGVLTLDDSGEIIDASAPVARLLAQERAALIGAPIEDVLPDAVQPCFTSGKEWVSNEVDCVEFFPSLDRWLEIRTATTDQGPTMYLRDVTDRERRRRDLDAHRNEVETLAQINETISDVLGALVQVSSREEIERTICERLGESELYRFAWVGERVLGDEKIRVRASAGESNDVLDKVRDGYGGDPLPPEQRALETGEIYRVTGLADGSAAPEPIRRVAFAQGLHSCLAVPLKYGSTIYGVLGIYADRQDALTDRERESFEALGRMTGFAINATRQRNLVLSDTVIELAYRIADRASPLVDVSANFASPLVVEGVVPVGEGELLAYVAIDDTRAVDLADQMGIELDARPVHGDEGELVEVHLGGTTALSLLTNLGATVRAAKYNDGVGELLVEVSPQENLRTIDQRLDDTFTDIQLLAKREREQSVETAGEFRNELRDRLTDRQLQVLKTAYLADYFESPRGSTSEELGEALDITGPTLLHHLRAAQRKLLDAFFEDLAPAEHRLDSIERPPER